MTEKSQIRRNTPQPARLIAALSRRLQRKCACDGSAQSVCEDCKRKKLQRRAASNASSPGIAPPIVHEVLQSPGLPLDKQTRSFFESRFGHDFSKVRVHSDEMAARSASAVDAHAYTVGRHVVFGAGQYLPDSHVGRQLIAHELTHVLQQRMSESLHESLSVGPVGDSYENEADKWSSLIMSPQETPKNRQTATVSGLGRHSVSTIIQRQNIPTGISLKQTYPLGHANLKTEEDKKKYLTYIADVSLMQLTPPGDYTAGQQKGDCIQESLTEVSNTCPGSQTFCEGHKCFQVNQYKRPVGDGHTGTTIPDGPDTFVDFHRARFPTSLLDGTGKKQCSVVCHQLYTYKNATTQKSADLGAFFIIRNFKEDKFTPSGSTTPINITTGEIRKTSAGSNTPPSKDDFAKMIAPGLSQSGALLDAPPVPQAPSTTTSTSQKKEEKK